MTSKTNSVLVVCIACFLVCGLAQSAGAAMPNLGRAPGEGGDNASGLVTEVVLPQLGLGNTGQALAGPIHDYLGVDAVGGDDLFAGLELANTGGGQTGLDNALSNVPGGTLAGDVVLPTLLGLGPDQRPGEVLPGAIHEYLGIDGLGGGDDLFAGLELANTGGGQTGLDNALSNVPGGTLAGDVVLPTLAGLEPGVRPGTVLPGAIRDYLGVSVGGGSGDLLVDLALAPGAPELFVSAPMSLGGSATANPEPMTMSLLGLGALALLKRRK